MKGKPILIPAIDIPKNREKKAIKLAKKIARKLKQMSFNFDETTNNKEPQDVTR